MFGEVLLLSFVVSALRSEPEAGEPKRNKAEPNEPRRTNQTHRCRAQNAATRAQQHIGLLFTASPLFTGPLAVGIFAQSSLGYLLGCMVSPSLYAMLGRDLLRQSEVAQPVSATSQDEAVNVA